MGLKLPKSVGAYLKGSGPKPRSGTNLGTVRARPARGYSRPATQRRVAQSNRREVAKQRRVQKRKQALKRRKAVARRKLKTERDMVLRSYLKGMDVKDPKRAADVLSQLPEVLKLAPYGRLENFSPKADPVKLKLKRELLFGPESHRAVPRTRVKNWNYGRGYAKGRVRLASPRRRSRMPTTRRPLSRYRA